MPTARLTDSQCRAAKPGARAVKMFDGGGLALVVLPSGAKSWRLFYRVAGRQQTTTLGLYPAVGVAEARKRAVEARERLRRGEDATAPRAGRHSAGPTLREACLAYWRGRLDASDGYRANALRGLELHVWPTLGARAVGEVTRTDVLAALAALDARGRHVYVRRVRVWLAQVLDWAVEHEHAAANVARSISPDRAFARAPVRHHAALPLGDVPAFVGRLAAERDLSSVLACRLLALTWVRTAELRMMRWDEIEGAVWRLPAGRMKRRREHLVPLSLQALTILEQLRLRAGGSPYVLPADHRDDRPISENAILYLIARIGYAGRMTGHGWRSVGSTWANERGYSPDAIERQLAHAPDDAVRAVYNRAAYWPERVKMMQEWADWLLPQSPRAPGSRRATSRRSG